MKLIVIPHSLAVIKLDAAAPLPDWIHGSRFYSVTRTGDELSIFCESHVMPQLPGKADGWRALRVAGTLELQLTGVISQLALPLASRQIPIFSISTHDTDYIVVGEDRLDDAIDVLRRAGHAISYEAADGKIS